jgi:hypothetical protein
MRQNSGIVEMKRDCDYHLDVRRAMNGMVRATLREADCSQVWVTWYLAGEQVARRNRTRKSTCIQLDSMHGRSVVWRASGHGSVHM